MMAASDDLINFDIIEAQKENIQSLPSGRSARKLAELFSPLTAAPLGTSKTSTAGIPTPTPTDTKTINDRIRADYETEVSAAAEQSDDPLDAWDRYARWALDAYPSAQATATCPLRSILERATRTFVHSARYRNDARYLRLWTTYIRLFFGAPSPGADPSTTTSATGSSNSAREAYVFLARHGIGDQLALFYEEYAAWLEAAGRWSQADEVFRTGLERDAQPAARLARYYGEFRRRREASEAGDAETAPGSPALPTVRPALAAKTDMFGAVLSPAGAASDNPQQHARARGGPQPATAKGSRSKLMVFSDADAAAQQPALGSGSSADGAKGWDSIGSLTERRKENVVEARPWVGETLKAGGKKNVGGSAAGAPKMAVFRDPTLVASKQPSQSSRVPVVVPSSIPPVVPASDQVIVNPQTGKRERVFVNLRALYPSPDEPGSELSFEEVWAARRGWLDKIWEYEEEQHHQPVQVELVPLAEHVSVSEKLVMPHDAVMLDENGAVKDSSRQGRGKKKKVMEINETHIIKAKLDSPSKPKIRKKSAEPTMTMHTKAATDEIYELFNQPIVKPAVREEEESDNDLYYETDGDYTSGAESTGTTRQVSTSEAGDDEPPEADEETSDVKSVSEWSDFTARKHVPQIQALLKKAEPQEAQEAEELDLIDINEVPSAEHTTDHSTETGTGTGPTMYHTADQTRSPGDSVEEAEHVIQTPEEEAEEAEDAGDADVDDVEEALVTPTEEEFSPPRTRSIFIPVMPEDYNPPTRRWRDPEDAANCRLPFMTPITERTESSLEMATEFQHRALEAKTPCKTDNQGTPTAASSSFEQFSSPLRDIVNEARSPPKLPMPRLQKLTKPAVAKPAATRPPARKGPIIKDLQCNPVDESIRAEILANIQPSLSSYSGFFDHRNEDYEHGGEIRRYIKSLAKAGKGGDRTANMTAAPVIQFVDTPTQYTVRKELGEGAFAPVYLVENSTAAAEEKADDVDQQQNGAVVPVMGRGAFGTAAGRRRRLEALKMEDPPSAWEFHMMRLVHSRLGPHERATRSIAVGLELHLYRDEGFLLMPFRPHGTLLDVVNQFRGEGTGMDELLVMFFTIELLRTIEAMHAKQLMHGDLKPDNCMLRLDDDDDGHVADKDGDGEDDLSPRYRADGSGGWSRRGLTLIDLGRGIDMRVFRPDVGFVADWKTCAQDCAEMREGRPWTWHVDYHGVASIVHCMLFGRYIETVRCTGPAFTSTSTTAASSFGDVSGLGGGLGNAAGRRYRIREPLKRYWQADLWGDLFEMMLNPAAAAASVPHPDSPNETAEEGGKMPLVRSMRRIRERMESWLEENCERGVGLRGLVMRLEAWARARRR